jgi:PEGA domain-containing protein
MREISRTLALLALLAIWTHSVHAQALAEAGMVSSNSSVAASSANSPPAKFATPAAHSSSPHLLERTGPPPSEVNRKEIEDNAGENAGKVLFRSVPDGADIFVNDLVVGRTPLLMVIAPGKYKIEMRGARQETGRTTIGVLPKETQTVVIQLKQKYPASISTR